ncbi:pilus assembly protein TadG-related protein, partial [Mesorhizobium sp.]
MFSSARDFVRSQGGSMLPMMALLAIPLLLAVGFSVDYTSAVTTRSNMQQALDAAILSITTLPTTTSKADRQTALQ